MAQRKLINIRVDADLWHQVKVEATKQGKSLQDFVDEALRDKLGKVSCLPEKPD